MLQLPIYFESLLTKEQQESILAYPLGVCSVDDVNLKRDTYHQAFDPCSIQIRGMSSDRYFRQVGGKNFAPGTVFLFPDASAAYLAAAADLMTMQCDPKWNSDAFTSCSHELSWMGHYPVLFGGIDPIVNRPERSLMQVIAADEPYAAVHRLIDIALHGPARELEIVRDIRDRLVSKRLEGVFTPERLFEDARILVLEETMTSADGVMEGWQVGFFDAPVVICSSLLPDGSRKYSINMCRLGLFVDGMCAEITAATGVGWGQSEGVLGFRDPIESIRSIHSQGSSQALPKDIALIVSKHLDPDFRLTMV